MVPGNLDFHCGGNIANRPLPSRFQICIKDAKNDDGAVWFDGKVDGVGEGIDGLDADVVVTDGGGSGQATDLFEIDIEGVGELESQAVRAAVVILESGIDIVDGPG